MMAYRNRQLEQWCGLAIYQPKLWMNVGVLFRTAVTLGNVNYLAIIGGIKYPEPKSDTVQAPNNIPLFSYDTFDDFFKHLPLKCNLVGIELCKRSGSLVDFFHPPRACYLLGSEDSGLPANVLKSCRKKVHIPSANGLSMNVSACGSIVLWDRFAKNGC